MIFIFINVILFLLLKISLYLVPYINTVSGTVYTSVTWTRGDMGPLSTG